MEEEKKEVNEKRKLGIRKKVIILMVSILILSVIIVILLYIFNKEFRESVDLNILKKNISTENVPTIDLDIDKSNQIYVYSKYIAILNEKKISLYNSYGDNISEIPVDINNAIFASSNKYLAIAEDNGKNLYLFLDTTYLWSGTIEGKINQIHVNSNGYISLVTTDATYKSIITLYDSEGKEILKKYLSAMRVIDVDISKDNKYLAVAELDTSGTLIQSNVEIVSVENTVNGEDKTVIYSYNAEKGKLITKIKYQDKGKLLCMYDDHIQSVDENLQSEDVLIKNSNITYASINLNNNYIYVTEEVKGLFKSNSDIHFGNNNMINTYSIEEVAKEIYACDNVIAINVGLETYFINDNGLLIKKVSSKQEITNIYFSNNLFLRHIFS